MIISKSNAVAAIPFRLPPPPFQTAAQLDAAAEYWHKHSIGWNHAEMQTRAEAAASRYWQTHPGLGRQGQPGFVPRYDPNARLRLTQPIKVAPQENCPQGISPQDSSPCCTQINPCNLCDGPCVVVSAQCPATACIWGDDDYGNHPTAYGGRCQDAVEGCIVGVHGGKPSGQCDPASHSVGDTIGLVGGKPRTIVDINEVFQADGLPYSSGGVLTVDSHVWGFVYKDNANQYWIQINPQFDWTTSFSVGINAWAASLGIALNAPTASPPRGPLLKAPPVPKGQTYAKCFSGGNMMG